MIWRLLASLAFMGGGVLTWVLLKGVKGYGASQAAMSAGTGGGAPDRDALIMCFLCSYFVISAVGVVFCEKKRSLRLAAALAYFALFVTFFGTVALLGMQNTNRMLEGVAVFAVIGLVYFAPWTLLWLLIIHKADKGAISRLATDSRSPSEK